MSLDVSLIDKIADERWEELSGIVMMNDDGESFEVVPLSAWQSYRPNTTPIVSTIQVYHPENWETVYSRNITHNLGKMAEAVGIYGICWRPEENGITVASQLIQPLQNGLNALLEYPTHYQQYNPKNGWGSYDGFVKFVEDYLQACIKYPDATVRASR